MRTLTEFNKSLAAVESLCSTEWKHIAAARARTEAEHAKIRTALEREIHPDTVFVVFGSLARGEYTEGSDLDWSLLIDGQVDESHLTTALSLPSKLTPLGFKKPGSTELFGCPMFSHELVHWIGGDADSNKNTTRRVLLLLESAGIGSGSDVRDRVITQLLGRYIEEDFRYRPPSDSTPFVPGFLLNDIVRFWRTMAVDYAAKRRARGGEGWALRRLKLRMSRKLIFVAGFAVCLECKLHPNDPLKAESEPHAFCNAMTEHLAEELTLSPLEVLMRTIHRYNADHAGSLALSAYDEFLGLLSDEAKRTALESLEVEEVKGSALFEEAEGISRSFREGILELFYETSDELTSLTKRFGVF